MYLPVLWTVLFSVVTCQNTVQSRVGHEDQPGPSQDLRPSRPPAASIRREPRELLETTEGHHSRARHPRRHSSVVISASGDAEAFQEIHDEADSVQKAATGPNAVPSPKPSVVAPGGPQSHASAPSAAVAAKGDSTWATAGSLSNKTGVEAAAAGLVMPTGDDSPGRIGFLMKCLGAILVLEIAGVVAFEFSSRQWTKAVMEGHLPAVHETRIELHNIFRGMPELMAPYFIGPQGSIGRSCVLVIIQLGLLSLFLAYVQNVWQKEWWDLFAKKDVGRFLPLMGFYCLLAGVWMMNSVYLGFLRSWLYIDWREFMTQRLTRRWLSSHSHYLLQLGAGGAGDAGAALAVASPAASSESTPAAPQGLDNPEQRIQEDVHHFVANSVDVVPDFLNSFGTLLVFMPIVWIKEPEKAFGTIYFPGWLLLMALIYALLGALSTHIIGWRMSSYSFAKHRYEADYRQFATHVRNSAESVALYNSEATEEKRLQGLFDRIKLVQWKQMLLQKRLSFFTNAFDFVQFLVPFFILAPSYFKGEVTLGDLFQLTQAIGNVSAALAWFVRVYGLLADWRATSDRLLSFEAAIDKVQEESVKASSTVKLATSGPVPASGKEPPPEEELPAESKPGEASTMPAFSTGGRLLARIGEIRLPSGEPVWCNVEIEVARGQRLLISGPEGIGKSVLFKALAGVWPYVSHSQIWLPVIDASEVLFVPQRPALPRTCTLGCAVAYPEQRSDYSDEELLTVLRAVQLDQLGFLGMQGEVDSRNLGGQVDAPSPMEGGASPEKEQEGPFCCLDRVDNWSLRLSPGQQQRIALAHVMLRKPKVVFLDEAMSSMSKSAAEEIFRAVCEQLPPGAIVVSISHDVATMASLHDIHLEVAGEGPTKELIPAKGVTSTWAAAAADSSVAY